ncbi:MAG: 16S rRNA processing protein RimM [Sandaracinus sp.]|nr:16S rRNA processing protein RimM [Sandaracinus sp.]|tara:strand:+ start:1272 stop:1784 length:513 start_codon:yes stop_codon:yes gene_type:complete
MSERVAIAAITRPHGVRGEVRVHPFNPDSDLLGRLKAVWAADEAGQVRELRIKRARRAPKHWIVVFEGVEGFDAAEALRGLELRVERDVLPALDEDEVYLADLEGLEVHYEDQVVGTVERVLTYPSVVCLEVVGPSGKKELPLVPPWVAELDIEEGWIRCESWDDVPEVG